MVPVRARAFVQEFLVAIFAGGKYTQAYIGFYPFVFASFEARKRWREKGTMCCP